MRFMARRKRLSAFLMLMIACLLLASCQNEEIRVIREVSDAFCPYEEMSNGTWRADGRQYRYRLEIGGRLPGAARDTVFVYLSNLEDITFEQAWKAAGLSSYSGDYFPKEDAVLVEMKTME